MLKMKIRLSHKFSLVKMFALSLKSCINFLQAMILYGCSTLSLKCISMSINCFIARLGFHILMVEISDLVLNVPVPFVHDSVAHKVVLPS